MSEPNHWWEQQHLGADYSRFRVCDVEANLYDQPSRQRIYGSPLYDNDGNLRCRACGQPMTRSMSKNGLGVASCSDTGCSANGFEFAEGSFISNPGRTHGPT